MLGGQRIVLPQLCCVKFSCFRFVLHKAWTSEFMSHCVHFYCKLTSLQHRNESISVSCASTCTLPMQRTPYALRRRGLSPLDVPSSCLLLYAELCIQGHCYLFTANVFISYFRVNVLGQNNCNFYSHKNEAFTKRQKEGT